MNRNQRLTRRGFHHLLLAGALALGTWPARRAAASTTWSVASELPENRELLARIQFVSESPTADQSCANCLLFKSVEDGLGKCSFIDRGLVEEQGWCISWTPRPWKARR